MKLKEEEICDLTLSFAFLRTIVKLSRGLKEFNGKKVNKLDQETWLCQTHFGWFCRKKLHHIRTILDHFEVF